MATWKRFEAIYGVTYMRLLRMRIITTMGVLFALGISVGFVIGWQAHKAALPAAPTGLRIIAGP